jgi:cytochrome c-type biogenesis protein CcmH
MRRLVLALVLATLALPAIAVRPEEILPDPALESRARALGKELRCLVCQNQSIDDSDADLARDLRRLVRERLVVGDTDPAIRSFLVDRYGDFVRLDPPLKASTMLLWFGPALVLALGLAGITVFIRRRQAETPDTLDASDRARLKRVLAEDDKR